MLRVWVADDELAAAGAGVGGSAVRCGACVRLGAPN